MKKISIKSQKLFVVMVFNTLLSIILYYFLGELLQESTGKGIVVQWVYLVLTLGFCVAYLIYNKGLVLTNKKLKENLPEDWSSAKKQALIDEGIRRREKSKWMLTIILPFIFTFIFDFIYLMYLDELLTQMKNI